MSKGIEQFYLVREDMLTEAMQKTLEAKELLESGKVKKINEAVKEVGLSRSAFYKYRDGIYPFHKMIKEKIITLSINLEDRSGTLSQLLSIVAASGCNVLTINQTIPLKGRANITLTIDTVTMKMEVNKLIQSIRDLETVIKVEVVGSGS
ncbi:ACT domain-containing protein [Alkalihalobacterium alkalinitrilicum]|uniref:ACT domain-containing protein n=1 Tax=Alkalihalobacterium alkalinitrilicum TaxID=427920 RepID=UPI0009950564|nr:ACT domain-containing protein [Alkalihalobacterium alkalinitrilicum]